MLTPRHGVIFDVNSSCLLDTLVHRLLVAVQVLHSKVVITSAMSLRTASLNIDGMRGNFQSGLMRFRTTTEEFDKGRFERTF